MPVTAADIYPAEKLSFAPFPSRRSTVHSTKGIVSCTQPLAARCGIKVLELGGNAADAAVATAAGLNMTEPGSTGIGGDMFCLFYDAKTKKTRALNGSGRSGSKCTLETVRKDVGLKDGEDGILPAFNINTVTVPGAAAGWVDTVAKFGSGKVTMEQILQPAIDLGEQGFPSSYLSALAFEDSERLIKRASPNFAELLKADSSAPQGCRAPKPGELRFNKTLANTFREVAKHGKKTFYEGAIAEAIIKVVSDLGGHLTMEDLANHAKTGSQEVDPISITFSGQGIAEPVKLWEHPPNGQGLVALMGLGMLEQLEKAGKIKSFKQSDHNSVEYLHALIEVLRLAFSDGTWFITDPDVKKISSTARRPSLSSDTVYFSVTDPEGNAASFIISNYMGFGTGIIPKGCGFTLQNRGANFMLNPPDHPNIYAADKRPYHTIIPAMVTNAADESLHTCFGVMGGFNQPQGQIQVLLNMLVFGMDPQSALDAPRVCIEPGGVTGEDDKVRTTEVYLEEGISAEVAEGLKALGHQVFVLDDFARSTFGRGQVIRRHLEEGQQVWSAGSDQRGDGQAIPL
ncbi:hypothetical protein MRB53_041859 [Persea americana]|nr:hypothetical protein MRB53_041859 [Persea americana]